MSNRTRIVTDDEMEKALDWLRDSAAEIGAAKADAVRASHMVRVVKALVMKRFNELSLAASEREAMASEEYRKALEEDAAAAGEYEKMRALRDAAALKIEAWRTEGANYRSMRI